MDKKINFFFDATLIILSILSIYIMLFAAEMSKKAKLSLFFLAIFLVILLGFLIFHSSLKINLRKVKYSVTFIIVVLLIISFGFAIFRISLLHNPPIYKLGKSEEVVIKIDSDSIIHIDDKAVQIGAVPEIKEGEVFLPLKTVSTITDAKVTWVAETQNIIIASGNSTIALQVGNPYAVINDHVRKITPPFTRDGVVMVPFMYIAEHLGFLVNWEAKTKTLTIQSRRGIFTCINPTVLYKKTNSQPVLLYFFDRNGNPVKDMSRNLNPSSPSVNSSFWTVTYEDGSFVDGTVDEISPGFYRFLLNTTNHTYVGFQMHYFANGTIMKSLNTIIIALQDKGPFNPYLDVNAVTRKTSTISTQVENPLEIKASYYNVADPKNWFLPHESVLFSAEGPVSALGENKYLITDTGIIKAKIAMNIWERVNKESKDWTNTKPDLTKACLHEYEKTFQIISIYSIFR